MLIACAEPSSALNPSRSSNLLKSKLGGKPSMRADLVVPSPSGVVPLAALLAPSVDSLEAFLDSAASLEERRDEAEEPEPEPEREARPEESLERAAGGFMVF